MNNHLRITSSGLILLGVLLVAGCDGVSERGGAHDDHAAEDHTPAVTNRIDIPSSVRSNLGISFVRVERRQVQKTLRVPGRFEYQPSARREYRTPLPGRVDLLVDQYERVEAGAVL